MLRDLLPGRSLPLATTAHSPASRASRITRSHRMFRASTPSSAARTSFRHITSSRHRSPHHLTATTPQPQQLHYLAHRPLVRHPQPATTTTNPPFVPRPTPPSYPCSRPRSSLPSSSTSCPPHPRTPSSSSSPTTRPLLHLTTQLPPRCHSTPPPSPPPLRCPRPTRRRRFRTIPRLTPFAPSPQCATAFYALRTSWVSSLTRPLHYAARLPRRPTRSFTPLPSSMITTSHRHHLPPRRPDTAISHRRTVRHIDLHPHTYTHTFRVALRFAPFSASPSFIQLCIHLRRATVFFLPLVEHRNWMGFPLADQTHHGCGYANKEADSTSRSSQAVPHPSTNQALNC